MKRILCSKILFGLVLAILIAAGSASAEPWKFGVISDTQWTDLADDPANQNPNTVAASIIKQVDQQFITMASSSSSPSATWWTPEARSTTTPGLSTPRTCTTRASAFTPARQPRSSQRHLYGLRRGFLARLPADRAMALTPA